MIPCHWQMGNEGNRWGFLNFYFLIEKYKSEKGIEWEMNGKI